MARVLIFCFVLSLVFLNRVKAVPSVHIHPVDPDEGASAPYTVQANETRISLERVGRTKTVYYGRFSSRGTADVVVSVAGADRLDATVRPKRLAKRVSIEGGAIRFTAEGIGPRVVQVSLGGKRLPPLFVILEPKEASVPDPEEANVFNVINYGVAEGKEPQTKKLQRALDDCAARPGGGTVVVPPGRYCTGTLRVRDNTYLYLAGGAVLQAVEDPDALPVSPGRSEHGGDGRRHSFSRVLLFDRAENAGLVGRGTIDGAGFVLRNQHGKRVQIIDAHGCHNLVIEGVVLRNTASWTLHILHSNNVRVSGVKIIADWDVGNADGIDPDACRNVVIERAFCYTGDDSIAIKTTANSDLLQSSHNIIVRDSVVMTRKTGLKIGTETRADIRNVLFENIDIVHSSRGIGLWVRDGGEVSQVTFRDIRMDLIEIPGESRSGQPFLFTLEKRSGVGRLRDVLIRDVTCRAPWFSLIESLVKPPVERITFENIQLEVTPRTDKKDVRPLFEFKNVRNLTMRGLHVNWAEAQRECWSGLWSKKAPVQAADVTEEPPSTPAAGPARPK